MNKLMTAVLGLTLMAGSAAFAQTTDAAAPASTDTKAATATPKAHKIKKHKKSSTATPDATTSATNPTK